MAIQARWAIVAVLAFTPWAGGQVAPESNPQPPGYTVSVDEHGRLVRTPATRYVTEIETTPRQADPQAEAASELAQVERIKRRQVAEQAAATPAMTPAPPPDPEQAGRYYNEIYDAEAGRLVYVASDAVRTTDLYFFAPPHGTSSRVVWGNDHVIRYVDECGHAVKVWVSADVLKRLPWSPTPPPPAATGQPPPETSDGFFANIPWLLGGLGVAGAALVTIRRRVREQAEREERERERLQQRAAERERLEQQQPQNRQSAPPVQMIPLDTWYDLKPDGRQVFTAEPTLLDRLYKLVVSSTFYYRASTSQSWQRADALHAADGRGNFSDPTRDFWSRGGIQLNDQPLEKVAQETQEDPAEHTYVFTIPGTGSRFGFLLTAPGNAPYTHGSLWLRLSATSQTKDHLLAAKKLSDEASALASDVDREIAEGRDFANPAFRQYYAQEHAESITKYHRNWHQEYHRVIFHQELKALLEQGHPKVLPWLDGRRQAFALAEAAMKPPPVEPAPEPPPKPKPTFEQWRAKHVVTPIEVDGQDTRAGVAAALRQYRQMLEDARQPDVPEAEREKLQAIAEQWLADALDEIRNGKFGTNNSGRNGEIHP